MTFDKELNDLQLKEGGSQTTFKLRTRYLENFHVAIRTNLIF